MSTKKPTALEVWRKGGVVTDWACDVDPKTGRQKSNGGVENIVEYDGRRYSIITDWAGKVVYRPNGTAVESDWEAT